MSDMLEVPDIVLGAMGECFTSYSKQGGPAAPTTDLPAELVDALIAYFEDGMGCDHSVGICTCTEAGLVAALKLSKEGKRYCPTCFGDGVVWQFDDAGDLNPPTCETCDGVGIVVLAGRKGGK